jgi:YYY domain-containing protein
MHRARNLSVPSILFVVLLAVVTVGVRIYGIDWDQGSLFHPDERAIYMKVWELAFPVNDLGNLLNPQLSPLNPRWFSYGSYPLYQLKVADFLISLFVELEWTDMRFTGRILSTLADTGTVLAVLVLGTRIFGRRTATMAAILLAFSVIHIQASHFYTVETFLTLFIVIAMLFLLKVMETGKIRHSAFAGIFIGLAFATKVSAAPILGALMVAHLMQDSSGNADGIMGTRPTFLVLSKAMRGCSVSLGVAAATFLLVAPFAVLDWPTFLKDVLYQGSMVTREIDLPYTRQYEHTLKYWYQVKHLSLWGLGIPLGLVAWSGLLFAIVTLWRHRSRSVLLVLAWVIPYFLIVGSFEVKFLRYLLPITPFLVLMGSNLLVSLVESISGKARHWCLLVQLGVILVILSTGLYAFAFLNIYSQPHTATRASAWIQENIGPGAIILAEHWDERVPNLSGYEFVVLPMYEVDTIRKTEDLARKLRAGDYLVFFSNRLYGTIPRLPDRYPMSSVYYRSLFEGKLGYQVVHSESAYPNFLGVSFEHDTFGRPKLAVPTGLESPDAFGYSLNLGYADESFTVYDHPKIIIFENVERLTQDTLLDVLGTSAANGKGQTDRLMLTEKETFAQWNGGGWQEIFPPEGILSRWVPWNWLTLVMVITMSVLPLALMLMKFLPDKGFLLAKPLGIVIVSYIVWLLVSLKVAAFSATTIYLAIGLVGIVSFGMAYWQRTELNSLVRERWRLWLIEEGIFLVVFLAFFGLRLANPDLWHPWRGGEKFMELAYLTATTKSTFMPPYDPWFAGGYLNYYYYGYFIVGLLGKALGIVPAVVFNLAIPLFGALTFSGSFSVVYNLVEKSRTTSLWHGIGWLPVVGGLTGGLFVGIIGNLDGILQVIQNGWRVIVENGTSRGFDYWRSSRLMPPDPPGFEVTEFPFWSFLFGDLHPHVMSMPFTILVLGLILTFLFAEIAGKWWKLSLGMALSLALGTLWPLNTWDYPTYAALVLIAIMLFGVSGGTWNVRKRGLRLASCGVIIGVSYILFLPFHLRYDAFNNGFVLSETQTTIWQYLIIHGLFVFIVCSYLGTQIGPPTVAKLNALFRSFLNRSKMDWRNPFLRRSDKNDKYSGINSSADALPLSATMIRLRELFLLFKPLSLSVVILLFVILLVADYSIVGLLLITLLGAGYVSWRHFRLPEVASKSTLFVMLVLSVGLSLGILVDLVTVKNDIGRMNTVFKFYEQAWVLFGITSAYLLCQLRFGAALSPKLKRIPQSIWVGFLVSLVLAVSVFPIMGTKARLQDRFQELPLTVDGTAYMEEAVYHDPKGGVLELAHDRAAFQWLQENIEGSPVIIEGITPLYRWGNRFSVYTGLPTVIGWDWHQRQQRGLDGTEVNQRRDEVDVFYSTADPEISLEILRKYRVRYVIVGELEHLYYPKEGLEKFSAMEGTILTKVYSFDEQGTGPIIYEVRK